jgi:hypothetical protein
MEAAPIDVKPEETSESEGGELDDERRHLRAA